MRKAICTILLGAATATAIGSAAPLQAVEANNVYDLAGQRAKIARIEMRPDTRFLNAEEREVVNLLIQASDLLNPIFLR